MTERKRPIGIIDGPCWYTRQANKFDADVVDEIIAGKTPEVEKRSIIR